MTAIIEEVVMNKDTIESLIENHLFSPASQKAALMFVLILVLHYSM